MLNVKLSNLQELHLSFERFQFETVLLKHIEFEYKK